MSSDPSIPAPGQPASPWQALVARIRAEGLDRPTPVRILLQYAAHVALCFGGLFVFIQSQNLFVQILGLVVSTYGATGISTCAHSASHRAITRNAKIDDALTFLGYTVLLGVSRLFWRDKHVVKHHRNPNNVELDGDIMLAPFFAINPDIRNRARGFVRWYYDHQMYFLPLWLGLNAINVQRKSWTFTLKHLAASRLRSTAHWVDLAGLAVHFTAWLIVPMFYFDPLSVVGVYLLRDVLIGYLMFAVFAPAHFPEKALCLTGNGRELDNLTRQTLTTVNFETGFIGRFLCCGVEYQIEHHLLAQISHWRYPELKPHIRRFCRENGYPYYSMSWYEGLKQSVLAFRKTKPVIDPRDLGLIDQAGNAEQERADSSDIAAGVAAAGEHARSRVGV